MIAAQQYYIDYSSDMNVDRLLTLLPNYIPDYCLTGVEKAVDRWAALVVQAYKKSYYVKESVCIPCKICLNGLHSYLIWQS